MFIRKIIFFLMIVATLAAVSCKSMEEEKAKENIKIIQEDEKTKLVLFNLQFAPNSSEITDEIENTLDYLKKIIVGYEGEEVIITGHAANIGDKSAIEAISLKRAQAVANYLVENQTFSTEVITVTGKGASEPIGLDDTAEENRRVEISIIGFDLNG